MTELPEPKRYVLQREPGSVHSAYLFADEVVAVFVRQMVPVSQCRWSDELGLYMVDLDRRYADTEDRATQTMGWLNEQLMDEFGGTAPPPRPQVADGDVG